MIYKSRILVTMQLMNILVLHQIMLYNLQLLSLRLYTSNLSCLDVYISSEYASRKKKINKSRQTYVTIYIL